MSIVGNSASGKIARVTDSPSKKEDNKREQIQSITSSQEIDFYTDSAFSRHAIPDDGYRVLPSPACNSCRVVGEELHPSVEAFEQLCQQQRQMKQQYLIAASATLHNASREKKTACQATMSNE